MELVVGVDGGNTKTLAVASDAECRAAGFGRGPCGNWEVMGEGPAAETITAVIGEALRQAGGSREDVVHAHMGLAGIDWPDDGPRMRAALVEAGWTCGLTLENDAFSPIRACAPEGHGIGVAAGTGIAAGIIRPDGDTYSYCAFVDMGGGRDIDDQVLHAVIRAEDGRGPATALTQGLLEVTARTTVPELVYDVHREGYHPPHGLVRPMLFAAANAGDGAAVTIVTRFGAELALCATNLIGRYDIASEEPPVVAAGTLFVRTGTLLFESFRKEVLAAAPRAQVLLEDRPPVMGAVRGALQARGWDSPDAWHRLNETAVREGWFEGDASDQAEGAESDR